MDIKINDNVSISDTNLKIKRLIEDKNLSKQKRN